MFNRLTYDAELRYRRSQARRAIAAARLARRVRPSRPRRMDSIHQH